MKTNCNLQYTMFDKVANIRRVQDNQTLSYLYGYDHQRIKLTEIDLTEPMNSMAVRAKWYDYASWLSPILVFNPISVGIWNALYYNQNY